MKIKEIKHCGPYTALILTFNEMNEIFIFLKICIEANNLRFKTAVAAYQNLFD